MREKRNFMWIVRKVEDKAREREEGTWDKDKKFKHRQTDRLSQGKMMLKRER